MQIELFGCTGAGKTTLAGRVLQACRQQGIDLQTSEDFVLGLARLDGVKGCLVRTLLLDLFSLIGCLATWRKNREFFAMARDILRSLPVAWPEKLNLARNILKRVGLFEIVRRYVSGQQLVLVDGGTLQIAHHLFVHLVGQANTSDVLAFSRLVPLPDVASHVTQRESVLIERTVERGHKRIPGHSCVQVETFVKQAVETFDRLEAQLVQEKRLLAADDRRSIAVAQDRLDHPLLNLCLDILRGELDTVIANQHVPVLESRGTSELGT